MSNFVAMMLFQNDTSGSSALGAGMGIGFTVIWLALVVLIVAALWKIFQKAGEPGWAAIVPIYNLIVLLKITGKPLWWIILFFIPLVNLIVFILMYIALAQKFGKGTGFAIGLLLLPPIFFPMLAWGDAQYKG